MQKAEEDIQQLNKDIEDLSDTQGQLLNKHAQIEKAEQECRKASEELDDCHKRRRSISDEISSKTQILENCNAALESANEVREKAAEYKQLSEQIIELEKDVLNHDNAKRNLAGYNADIQNCQNIINDATLGAVCAASPMLLIAFPIGCKVVAIFFAFPRSARAFLIKSSNLSASYPIIQISSCFLDISSSRLILNAAISSSHFSRWSASSGKLFTSSIAFARNLQLALSISGQPEFFINSSCCLISEILSKRYFRLFSASDIR